MTDEKRAVLVTTVHKGVFFGRLESFEDDLKIVTLNDARNCIYWSEEVHGFLGLAATGPTKGTRVGPAVPVLTLTDVTSIADCTAEATKAWEKATWPR